MGASSSNAVIYRTHSDSLDKLLKPADVEVEANERAECTITPCPADNLIRIEIHSEMQESSTIEVYSARGDRVLGTKTQLNAGMNSIPVSVDALPIGSYVLHLKTASGIQSKSFVIYR